MFRLGECCLVLGDEVTAEAHLRRALELSPDYAEARVALATTLQNQGKTEEAKGEYISAVAQLPEAKRGQALLGLGLILLDEGDEQALTTLSKAAHLLPGNSAIRDALSEAQARWPQ